LPTIDIQNIGNRVAKNVVVELLPKDFGPDGSDRVNRTEPIGDMPPGYERQIEIPKSWYNVFNEDLIGREGGRKDWPIKIRWASLLGTPRKETFVFGVGTGTVMSDRSLDNWNKLNRHLRQIEATTKTIGDQLQAIVTLERERIHGDVLYLRVGSLFDSLSGPYFVPFLDGDRAKELIEGANMAMCPDGTPGPDSIPECRHSEEIVNRLRLFRGHQFFRWGVDDSSARELLQAVDTDHLPG